MQRSQPFRVWRGFPGCLHFGSIKARISYFPCSLKNWRKGAMISETPRHWSTVNLLDIAIAQVRKREKCLSTTIKSFEMNFACKCQSFHMPLGPKGHMNWHSICFCVLAIPLFWKIQVARATSLSSHMVFKCHQTPTIFFQKKYSRITPPSISLIFQIPITLPVQWVYLLSNNSTCTINSTLQTGFPLVQWSPLMWNFKQNAKCFWKFWRRSVNFVNSKGENTRMQAKQLINV